MIETVQIYTEHSLINLIANISLTVATLPMFVKMRYLSVTIV